MSYKQALFRSDRSAREQIPPEKSVSAASEELHVLALAYEQQLARLSLAEALQRMGTFVVWGGF
jgi:hypothetical protein